MSNGALVMDWDAVIAEGLDYDLAVALGIIPEDPLYDPHPDMTYEQAVAAGWA